MNDISAQEINSYKKKTIKLFVALSSTLLISAVAALIFHMDLLALPLFGAVAGVVFATLNVFALGHAFVVLVISKGSRTSLLWPITSFLAMCMGALFCAQFFMDALLGFAIGITVPIFFASFIVSSLGKPA